MIETFTKYLALEPLPPLVRKQRRLENKIAPILAVIEQEKAVRKDIDALLVKAGLASGDTVTCLGYDVRHNERAGQQSINEVKLVEQFVAQGLDRALVEGVLEACKERGAPSAFASVKPSKGAKVRP